MDVVAPTLGEALVGLKDDAASFDVLVSESHLMTPLVDAAAHFAESKTAVAHAWMSDEGPGVFVPGSSEPDEDAGFGVADPTAMLFTTSLLLAEGLRRRPASRTLERAVGEAIGSRRDPRDARVHGRRARAAAGRAHRRRALRRGLA